MTIYIAQSHKRFLYWRTALALGLPPLLVFIGTIQHFSSYSCSLIRQTPTAVVIVPRNTRIVALEIDVTIQDGNITKTHTVLRPMAIPRFTDVDHVLVHSIWFRS